MQNFIDRKKFKTLSFIFGLFVLFLTIAAYLKMQSFEYVLRLFCIPTLMILYFVNSGKKNKLYLFALVSATISNIFFVSKDVLLLKYGLIAFIIYRVITLFIVQKNSPKLSFFSVIIGSVFFLFPLLYFIILIEDSIGESFFVGLINIILVSILGGMSLANYLLENNIKHVSLLTSTLLYTILVLLFVIQKYFLFIPIFDPLRVIVLMTAHYFFCFYVLKTEENSINK